ncbi:MAG TPA: transketolase [Bacteroidetes bacterium]|nr:transketolase [Bacteroidota bacterium]HCN36713.1 transketolase [Bacteroidota bacterium]
MAKEAKAKAKKDMFSGDFNKEEILADYKLANESRQASLLGRKEVLTGKAKFGIFGDGKEIPQIAMAKTFQNGDFRSGYYRDQTFMMAIGQLTVKEFFAQLYATPDVNLEPASAGRSMNGHFATRSLDENGNWKNLMQMKNSSADISPTGSQMQRLVGLAYASKLYRNNKDLHKYKEFTDKGNEVAFGTIGNASCAEGMFFESINAAGVLMVPMAISIWDDGYGISVPNSYQITKQNISEILKGFEYDEVSKQGYYIFKCKGWDYEGLIKTYKEGIELVRKNHIPAIFHITEVTQPQGHSTSGSHERYKDKNRLQWENDFCCIKQMRYWILEKGIASEKELDKIEEDAKLFTKKSQEEAWKEYLEPINKEKKEVCNLFEKIASASSKKDEIIKIKTSLEKTLDFVRKPIVQSVYDVLLLTKDENSESRDELLKWNADYSEKNSERYNSYLYSESEHNALNIEEIKPVYKEDSPLLNGFEILNNAFDNILSRDPRVFIIGEDVGNIGDVNQGLAGMQKKYGEIRVTDTGIREATIAGQGIGAAERGLKPIIEIQYLDYVFYALQILSDDVACLQYRTKGGQKAPLIVRTRGHRLEGIWHSGSPMGTVINCLRGMYICVPRNMTQAAGFYNTLLKSDEPGLIVERLNAYRLKEKLPENIGEFCVPLGVPEKIEEGTDITIVTYGACVDIAKVAISKLKIAGISTELIDVQTLVPFDRHGIILNSLKKTNRVLFLDEDVPGGASAYMMQQVIDEQGGYMYLDSPPKCLAAQPHRPAYGTDGDYFSKPNSEDVFKAVYEMMNEAEPEKYKIFY